MEELKVELARSKGPESAQEMEKRLRMQEMEQRYSSLENAVVQACGIWGRCGSCMRSMKYSRGYGAVLQSSSVVPNGSSMSRSSQMFLIKA